MELALTSSFARSESVITVQRAFHIKFQCNSLSDNNIRRWYHQFEDTGCLCKGKSTGQPRLTEARVEQLLQALQPTDYGLHANFAKKMLLHNDDDFLDHVIFSDELTFHLSGHKTGPWMDLAPLAPSSYKAGWMEIKELQEVGSCVHDKLPTKRGVQVSDYEKSYMEKGESFAVESDTFLCLDSEGRRKLNRATVKHLPNMEWEIEDEIPKDEDKLSEILRSISKLELNIPSY
ncbi:hypothetical protein J437_LFUL008824 [Ladona fulva]|uniref:DUF4817 domain-containing protein n=1 Tax=Ladona fulva TaxID=123851 RepID=A0A8K0P3J8_LADFU|nr:hypothetical protein J437_LFUL008824 [Ladona fulva]